MFRAALFALGCAAVVAGAASAQAPRPVYGKAFTVDFPDPGRNRAVYQEFVLPIEQGDQLRFEITPVGGAEMSLQVELRSGNKSLGNSPYQPAVDWQSKRLPGTMVNVRLNSNVVGRVSVRITKAGDPAAAPVVGKGLPATPPTASSGVEDRLKRLEEQNEELSRQLAEIRRLLEQKK